MQLFGTITLTEYQKDLRDYAVQLTERQMDRAEELVREDSRMQAWFAKYKQERGRRGWVYSFEFGDPDLPIFIREIHSFTGNFPTPWKLPRAASRDDYYIVSLRREYASADLDKAPYVALFATRRLAKMAPRRDFGPLQVVGNKMLEKPKAFGRLDPYVVRGMNTWLKEELTKRNLKGFAVREIEILNRKPQHQAIWEPWSSVTMPRCCLPLVDSWGEPCGPELSNTRGCHYECGPYMPEEKVFLRSEVEALGGFDIAVCQEHVGNGNNDRFPPLVVSQRFRQVLKELKVPGVAYAPVWLKEPGEPLWTNPWEEFLGPYPEQVPLARSFEE